MPGLDGRHRDANGRVSQKRADTKLDTLRRSYPELAREKRGTTTLGALRAESGKSLSKMVRSPRSY